MQNFEFHQILIRLFLQLSSVLNKDAYFLLESFNLPGDSAATRKRNRNKINCKTSALLMTCRNHSQTAIILFEGAFQSVSKQILFQYPNNNTKSRQ